MTKTQRSVLKQYHVGLRHFNEDISYANALVKNAGTNGKRVEALRNLYCLAVCRGAVGEARQVLQDLLRRT